MRSQAPNCKIIPQVVTKHVPTAFVLGSAGPAFDQQSLQAAVAVVLLDVHVEVPAPQLGQLFREGLAVFFAGALPWRPATTPLT